MRILLLMVLLTSYNNASANERVIKDIKNLENKLDLPTGSFETIVKMESGFNEKLINKQAPISSYGVGQLTLATARLCGLTRETILNYRENLECSARLFKSKLERYKQDLDKAVVAYNEGTPCICENGIFKRHLSKVTQWTCARKLKVQGKVVSQPIRCSEDGKLLETKYLAMFREIYGT